MYREKGLPYASLRRSLSSRILLATPHPGEVFADAQSGVFLARDQQRGLSEIDRFVREGHDLGEAAVWSVRVGHGPLLFDPYLTRAGRAIDNRSLRLYPRGACGCPPIWP